MGEERSVCRGNNKLSGEASLVFWELQVVPFDWSLGDRGRQLQTV